MDREVRRTNEEGSRPGHAHVIGVGERGMTGLAQLLVERGFSVSGSAAAAGPLAHKLRALGIRVHGAHQPASVPASVRLMVYARQVGRDHPERLAGFRLGAPQASSAQVRNQCLASARGVAIWGAQAGSVAAAMVAYTLTQAGRDPTVLLSRAAPQLGGWGRLGRGPWCVTDAHPIADAIAPAAVALAAAVEADGTAETAHAAALHEFFSALPSSGYALGAGHDGTIVAALRGIAATTELFSLGRGYAWCGADLREERGRYRFRAFHRGRFVVEARLQVPGRRNVCSALAAVAVCHRMELPAPAIREGLEEFAGLQRGLESRGSWRGVTLVDDEAYDPRLVAEALGICRQLFGRRTLGVVVQAPPVASWAGLARALAAANWVLVVHLHPGLAGTDVAGWLDALADAGVCARQAIGLQGALVDLEQHLEPGDVLLTLGSDDVGMIADALSTRRAPRDSLGR